ncbi:MAG: GAF domain-containing protein, partial [Anaerococcus sp.]|nr:GAF domain-containing protein [Peptoniphilaceae bacterium]MDY2918874.1 GAF domain-containing protein [Anaerococcus sp.]
MGFELKGISKLGDKERLDELISYIKIQLDDEDDSLALMANISAFIMAILKDLNWAGFYLVGEDDLVLGPFQGLPACTRLAF